jgi:hypothetical protein
VAEYHEAIRAAGGEVLAVSFTRPDRAAAYLKTHPLPFAALCDPERQAYRALGLGRARWGSFFRPKVLAGFLRHILKGWLPARPAERDDDLLQLGGDFVLDRQRRLVFAYRSADATDRPPPQALLEAVRQAARAESSPPS